MGRLLSIVFHGIYRNKIKYHLNLCTETLLLGCRIIEQKNLLSHFCGAIGSNKDQGRRGIIKTNKKEIETIEMNNYMNFPRENVLSKSIKK